MKKALLIGINYTGTSSELNGCINDVNNISKLLTDTLKYPAKNIKVLTDKSITKPTYSNILSELNKIVKGSNKGDQIWIHYSGHGHNIRDTNGDEEDGRDEVIVPLDYEKKGFITDDTIKSILHKLNPLCKCVCIFDACHSGSMADLPYSYSNKLEIFSDKVNKVEANVLVISGCKDSQTSADANINYKWTGALTYYLLKALKESGCTITLGKLMECVKTELKTNGYSQYPVLSSSKPLDLEQYFMFSKQPFLT